MDLCESLRTKRAKFRGLISGVLLTSAAPSLAGSLGTGCCCCWVPAVLSLLLLLLLLQTVLLLLLTPLFTSSAAGSHMLNSASQFCRVLIGIIHRTVRALVWLRNTSQNEITCRTKPVLTQTVFSSYKNHTNSLISRFSQWLFTNDGQVDICTSPTAGPEKGHS